MEAAAALSKVRLRGDSASGRAVSSPGFPCEMRYVFVSTSVSIFIKISGLTPDGFKSRAGHFRPGARLMSQECTMALQGYKALFRDKPSRQS
jgi:hypothetical protein